MTWEAAAAPLAAFCRNPQRAPDRDEWLPPVTTDQEAEIARLSAEVDQWRDLATRYAQGRLMRALRALDRLRRRWRGGA